MPCNMFEAAVLFVSVVIKAKFLNLQTTQHLHLPLKQKLRALQVQALNVEYGIPPKTGVQYMKLKLKAS